MRGGRGGRGGGRGRSNTTRRHGRGNFIQEFIRDSFEDDQELFETDDKNPPKLYPFINLPPVNPISADDEDRAIVEKSQSLSAWFKKSPYYLSRKVEETDNIQRYSDKYRRLENQPGLYDHIDLSDTCEIPFEILADVKKIAAAAEIASNNKAAITASNIENLFQRLESNEKNASSSNATNAAAVAQRQVSEENKDNLSEAEFQEGDLDGDYGVDYYASDNDDDNGGDDEDREATF